VYTLTIGLGGPVATTNHFGAAVRASPDLNGDGVGDILVGAPDYGTLFPFGPGKGDVAIFSGATGARLESVVGNNGDHLGDGTGRRARRSRRRRLPGVRRRGLAGRHGGTDSGAAALLQVVPLSARSFSARARRTASAARRRSRSSAARARAPARLS
jgi:hypothetical protein